MKSTSQREAKVFDPFQVTRPSSALMKYYIIVALFSGPLFPIVILPLYFKYETLKYKFDKDGVSMSWGILWRHEVHLTYRRIQDIHLTANILQRWLGLATVSIQTASGGSMPEMSIEGILEADEMRDFLYAQMRGAQHPSDAASTTDAQAPTSSSDDDEAIRLLIEIRDSLRKLASRTGEQS